MAWAETLFLLLMAHLGDASQRSNSSKDNGTSSFYSGGDSARIRTGSATRSSDKNGATLAAICPITANDVEGDYGRLLDMSATQCGSAACCTFRPLTMDVLTWAKYDIQPVTVGAEVVVIDSYQGVTSTTTEIITTAIVVTLRDKKTTLDPSLWINNGTFDGGSNVPTRTEVMIDGWDNKYTITYPSAYVVLETEMWWQGSIPVVTAGTTSCLQNHGSDSRIPSPTSVSTPEMTADPTDPKGLFYTLGGAGVGYWQMPGLGNPNQGHTDLCGGAYASDIAESWGPGHKLEAVYSNCYCQATHVGPVAPLSTVSFLLDSKTRYARLASAGRSSLVTQEAASSASTRTIKPEPMTNTSGSSQTSTIQSVTGTIDQTPDKVLNIVSTTTNAGPSQNVVPSSKTRTAEWTAILSPTLSISPPRPSPQIKSTENMSASATTVNSASSWSVPSIEKSMAPPSPSSLSSSGDSTSPAPSTQRTTEIQSVRTQANIVNPQIAQPTSSGPGSSTQNSTPIASSVSKSSADLGLSSQDTTHPPSVLVKPMTASLQPLTTSSDTPPDAVIVADGQLSVVSAEPFSHGSALLQSSSIHIGDIIANGIGETRESSATETTSQKSVSTASSPTTDTAVDTKTSSPIITTSQASRTSESSQTRSSTSQKSTSRAIASPTRASSSSRSSETTRATGDIIASVMGVTRSTGLAERLGSERWTCFAVGLLIFYLAI